VFVFFRKSSKWGTSELKHGVLSNCDIMKKLTGDNQEKNLDESVCLILKGVTDRALL